MIKTGWHKMCHRLVFVDAPRPIRFERAKSRGWTAADFSRREARQEPVEFKRNLADTVIDNSGDQTDTAKQVERFWTTLSKRER
jgi:dephospho-CoA kinase